MSELSTQPVFTCKRCGTLYSVSHLSTSVNDPDGHELYKFLENIARMGYCQSCLQAKQWYTEQGRLEDFVAGRP